MLLLFLCDSDYYPRASLTRQTGQPVVEPNGSVILRLDHSSGLQGWNCFVIREYKTYWIVLKKMGNDTSLDFQPNSMKAKENVFWCSSADKSMRSNQVTIRTSSRCSNLQIRLCSSNMRGNENTVCVSNPLQVSAWFVVLHVQHSLFFCSFI